MVSSVNEILGLTRLSDCVELLVVAQLDPSEFPMWIFHALVWGYLVLLILGIIVGLVLWIQGRGIRKKAEAAGVEAPLPDSHRDLKPFGIHQGVWVLLGAILVGVAVLVGPIIQATVPQTVIAAGAFLILAGVAWFFVFAGIVYIFREYPKRQRALEETIQHKGARVAKPKRTEQCSACGEPLHEDEQFCGHCGAASS